MSKVRGKDVVLEFFNGGFYKPAACGLDCDFDYQTEYVETAVSGAGNFRTIEPTRDSWTVSCSNLVSLKEVNMLSLPELRQIQRSHLPVFIHFTHTSTTGQVYEVSGYAFIVGSPTQGTFAGMNSFNLSLVGSGPYSESFVPSPINPPGIVHRLEFTLGLDQDTYTNALLIGKEILEVIKGSLSIDKIITSGTPASDEAKYTSGTGTIQTGVTWSGTENGYIIYQDM